MTLIGIKATIEKIIFTAADKADGKEGETIKKVGMEGQLSAEAESGIEFGAVGKIDLTKEKIPMKLKADFTGITLKLVGKVKIFRGKKSPKQKSLNDKFNLIKRQDDIIKTSEFYVL